MPPCCVFSRGNFYTRVFSASLKDHRGLVQWEIGEENMLISEVLAPSLIKLNVEAKTKEELFEEMVQLFVSAGIIADREAAVMALIEREQKMSTGIAPDFALPHGKIMGIKGVAMALGIIRGDGMDFDSLDDEPVHVVLTLFSEVGNPGPHIEALSEISRLIEIPGLLESIKEAASAEEIIRLIKKEELPEEA